jgi:hypothetical protein
MAKKRKPVSTILARYEVAESGCWEWTGSRNKFGYGQVCVTPEPGVHTIKGAHRLSYEHHVGPIPNGAVVMHICDNRGCINPAHLRVGSQAENLDDARDKGRMRLPNGQLVPPRARLQPQEPQPNQPAAARSRAKPRP